MRYRVYKCYDFERTGVLELENGTDSLSLALSAAADWIDESPALYITSGHVAVWDTEECTYILSMCYVRGDGWFKC